MFRVHRNILFILIALIILSVFNGCENKTKMNEIVDNCSRIDSVKLSFVDAFNEKKIISYKIHLGKYIESGAASVGDINLLPVYYPNNNGDIYLKPKDLDSMTINFNKCNLYFFSTNENQTLYNFFLLEKNNCDTIFLVKRPSILYIKLDSNINNDNLIEEIRINIKSKSASTGKINRTETLKKFPLKESYQNIDTLTREIAFPDDILIIQTSLIGQGKIHKEMINEFKYGKDSLFIIKR